MFVGFGALRLWFQASKPDLPDLAFFLLVLCPMSNRVGGQGAKAAKGSGAETCRLGQHGRKMTATSSPMDVKKPEPWCDTAGLVARSTCNKNDGP